MIRVRLNKKQMWLFSEKKTYIKAPQMTSFKKNQKSK